MRMDGVIYGTAFPSSVFDTSFSIANLPNTPASDLDLTFSIWAREVATSCQHRLLLDYLADENESFPRLSTNEVE